MNEGALAFATGPQIELPKVAPWCSSIGASPCVERAGNPNIIFLAFLCWRDSHEPIGFSMSDKPDTYFRTGRRSQMESYLHVLHALMLRDMRTRFGGSHWGYIVIVLWPVAHVFMLVLIYVFRSVPAPIGDSRALFFASGALPVLAFQYISREVMKAVIFNRPLTYYPQVKVFDLIASRVLVEIVTGFLVLTVVVGVLLAAGVNPVPKDPFTSMCGYLAAILLGIGVGTINVSIVAFFPAWIFGFVIFTIVIYITSGVMFLPNYLPAQIYDVLKYNPAVQVIEWVRLGFYPDLGVTVDYLYVIIFSFTCMTIGLILEKTVVRKKT